jgi:hypothetical protein
VPGLLGEAEGGAAVFDAVALFIEETDGLPVVSSCATNIDLLSESRRVIGDGGAGEPQRLGDLHPRVAQPKQAPYPLSGDARRSDRRSSLYPLRHHALLALLAQSLNVISDCRIGDSEPMCDLVEREALREEPGHRIANLGHEHMFAFGLGRYATAGRARVRVSTARTWCDGYP